MKESRGSECGARFTLKPRATATPERFRLSIALVLKHPVSICRSSRCCCCWMVVAPTSARALDPLPCGSFYSPLVDGRDDCHVGNLWSPQMPFEIRPIGWAAVDTCHASFATFTSASDRPRRLIIRPIIFRAGINGGAGEITCFFRKFRELHNEGDFRLRIIHFRFVIKIPEKIKERTNKRYQVLEILSNQDKFNFFSHCTITLVHTRRKFYSKSNYRIL